MKTQALLHALDKYKFDAAFGGARRDEEKSRAKERIFSFRNEFPALVTGFMAKESVVSTLTVLFGTTEALLGTITAAGAAALLVFCLLYTPCVAAVASIKRELGGKWAFFVVIGQCVIAWLAAFAVHTVAMLF